MILLAIGLTLSYTYERHTVSRDGISAFLAFGAVELLGELTYLARLV